MCAYTIGLDLGGTKIAAALVGEDGVPGFKVTELTHLEQGADAVIERMAGCIRDLQAQSDAPVLGLGIGTAGMTDSVNGVVIMASNLKWKNVPVRRLLAEKLGQDWLERTWVDKDTNAAVLGERLYGAGRGSRHMLYVTVGTGVGGGMVLDGKLYHGASQGASDIGHLVMLPEGPLCGCGKRGCLEALSSGPAIARTTTEALESGAESQLRLTFAARPLSAQDVVEAALRGDALSCQVMEQAGTWLGRGLAYYVDINNPEFIIIGGGIAAGGLLLEPVRRAISQFALPANTAAVQVLPAGLGPDSGVIGAAALAWHQLEHTSF
ncbi:MAG: NagC [Chloroflexi bacterium]|jgi:glucokinase|nr:NagC [Chloroflexota bacterium]